MTTRGRSVAHVGILGAGRQALETSGYCHEAGLVTTFFIEEHPPAYSRDASSFGASILSFSDDLVARAGTPVLTAVGSPELRRRLVERWPGDVFLTLISAHAWLAGDAVVGAGTTVAPRAALNRCVRIGEHVLINVGAILSHDVTVADFATISPGCAVGGGVTVGPAAFLGIGATVRDQVTIGAGAIVAAGAVVIDDVAENSRVMGVPARPVPRR